LVSLLFFLDYLEKLANVCKVFAMRVNFLDAFSFGYSNEKQNLEKSFEMYQMSCFTLSKAE